MERSKYFTKLIFVVCLFVGTLSLSAQTYQDRIFKAYLRGEMDKWLLIMNEAEINLSNGTFSERLELINLYYGYTGWLVSVKENKKAVSYIEKAENQLDKLKATTDKNKATILAYRGAFIAYKISISNLKAIYLGRTSMKYLDEALELDPRNVQANIEMGNAMYYCPTTFGGDKLEAVKYYKQAVSIVEEQNATHQNWVYLNVLTMLGMAYEDIGNIQEAKISYEKAIEAGPNFMWVGEELYPDLLRRHNL